MKGQNVLLEKTLRFAVSIVRVCKQIEKSQQETVLSRQLLRSGTSIGANAQEAVYGISRADFIAKLHIALKETAETEYWLRLLSLSGYLREDTAKSLLSDCLEIKRILIATLNTAKESAGL